MKSYLILITSALGTFLFPNTLAQGTFGNALVTTSIRVSNLSASVTDLDPTGSQGEISGIIYYNNCNFTSTLFGSLNYPNGSANTIPLTSNLNANNSEWVKFNSSQVPDNSQVSLSATSSPGPAIEIPFAFTTINSSDCNARVVCNGSPLDYSLTLEGFQCFDSLVGTASLWAACAGLYVGSEGLQLPCQPGSICTYLNQFDSQCLPI